MLDERRVAMLKAMGITAWQPRTHDETALQSAAMAEPQEPPAELAALLSPPPGITRPAQHRAPPAPAAGAVVRADLSDMDWPSLAATASTCQACRLCEGRRQVVFGVGAPQSQWLVVGEAPGEQEDLKGEPFVGPSGQLLDSMLAAIGVSRTAATAPDCSAYIANAIKCRPPGNRNPEPDEMAACEPFLKRQIALLRPRIILAMGRFAVQSILRSTEPIGKLRGRVHSYEGVPLVVTYHPAYLLRNLPEKAKAWDDLVLAMSTFKASTGG
jgi:DNA polymerase